MSSIHNNREHLEATKTFNKRSIWNMQAMEKAEYRTTSLYCNGIVPRKLCPNNLSNPLATKAVKTAA
jgi:hypothetical protein